ncbi:hypothetical protein NL108_008060 [Boleophthalmus pectinirostris]|nr:hypothetical protein NL108_008060 [Boleophthalmus pectinirostris]
MLSKLSLQVKTPSRCCRMLYLSVSVCLPRPESKHKFLNFKFSKPLRRASFFTVTILVCCPLSEAVAPQAGFKAASDNQADVVQSRDQVTDHVAVPKKQGLPARTSRKNTVAA